MKCPKINVPLRFKNPIFVANLVLSLVVMPVLVYNHMEISDFTTWQAIYKAVVTTFQNPYLFFVIVFNVWNAFYDPTSVGVSDAQHVLDATKPIDTSKDTLPPML